jgi:hypothetical protein
MTLEASAIMKRRQPFPCMKPQEEPKTKTEASRNNFPAKTQRLALARHLQPESTSS